MLFFVAVLARHLAKTCSHRMAWNLPHFYLRKNWCWTYYRFYRFYRFLFNEFIDGVRSYIDCYIWFNRISDTQ